MTKIKQDLALMIFCFIISIASLLLGLSYSEFYPGLCIMIWLFSFFTGILFMFCLVDIVEDEKIKRIKHNDIKRNI